jgi:hypothetical protein
MRRFGIAAVLAGLLAVSAAGQEAVEIKIAHPKAGQRVKVTATEKRDAKTTVGKNVLTESRTRSLVYIDDVIENPGDAKLPTKLKRTFEKAVVGRDGKDAALPIEGKTVLIEKKGDKYTFTVDGKPVEGESLRVLEGYFRGPNVDPRQLLLPGEKVKPGDTWKVDAAKLAKLFGEASGGFTIDPQKTKAGGTLVRTSKQDGRQLGVIELRVEGPIVGLKPQDTTIKGGKLTLAVTGSGCIDGTVPVGESKTDLRLTLTGTTADGTDATTEIDATETRKVELLPKK